MNKVQGFIVSLEKFEEIEISENYQELLKRTEPLVMKVVYNNTVYTALYDELKQKIFVFDF